jgi:hypothetical protein
MGDGRRPERAIGPVDAGIARPQKQAMTKFDVVVIGAWGRAPCC